MARGLEALVRERAAAAGDWRACLDPAAELVEVRSSHAGMSVHPRVYRAIADALAGFWPQPRASGR